MLRFTEIAFGPIHSRRLGSSLGVNLLPPDGKRCNFDCIYCELGWNKDAVSSGRMPFSSEVRSALEAKLRMCREESVAIDSITFSGNGEPTLNPDFPEIVDDTLLLRDKYYPSALVTVFSNSTTLGNTSIVEALSKVDNPVLKVDSVFPDKVALVNRPACKWELDAIEKSLVPLRDKFILQTIFFKSSDYDTAKGIDSWMDFVRRTSPKEIMVYTLDRETPYKGLVKYSCEEMRQLVFPLIDEGYNVQIRG